MLLRLESLLICMLFSQQINQLYKDTVLEVLLLFINMLSFLALFLSPLLSKPRRAVPGNEASYSTDVPEQQEDMLLRLVNMHALVSADKAAILRYSYCILTCYFS